VFAEEEARLLVAHAADPAMLAEMVRRRLDGVPLEQVLGWVDFGGLRIGVQPGVFVPRRRTELLAERAVAAARAVAAGGRTPVFVELCCGSGAVSAVLLAALDHVELYASDVDPVAVRCARGNLGERAHVVLGDLYGGLPAALAGRVDVLVANAPYVPLAELALMPPEARLYEPPSALSGGDDGLDVLRGVIAGAPVWLAAGGTLVVEAGAIQVDGISALMAGAGLRPTTVRAAERGATAVIGNLDAGPY
jgi:release factor glutamine methyltransferase